MTTARLEALLTEAQERGFLGPGPVSRQLEHSADFARALGPFEGRLLDLGSGAGLPGLVLITLYPLATAVLLDSNTRRCEFLEESVTALALRERCAVVNGRAEDRARSADLRGHFDLVVARSFGPPAPTAECAVGFLAPGGRLAVTEPPPDSDGSDTDPSTRWPTDGLARLGLTAAERVRHGDTSAAVMRLTGPVSDQWPRRDGVPAKRPLWTSVDYVSRGTSRASTVSREFHVKHP